MPRELGFCKTTERIEHYDTMDKYINSRLDILKFLKHLDIMDKFRLLMLNKEQNISLEFLKQVNIANSEEMDLLIQHDDKSKLSNLVFLYFSNRIKNGKMTEVDEKLFPLIDPEFKTFWTSSQNS